MLAQVEEKAIPWSAKDFRKQQIRQDMKRWLADIMKLKGWSAEKWAREAGIAGTTITRFLNTDDQGRTPSYKTLDLLARAARVPVMSEKQQVLVAIIHRSAILHEALRCAPGPVDLFAMTSEDLAPAPRRFKGCTLAEMDNGRYAVCRKAEPVPGKPVLVQRGTDSFQAFWYTPPLLVPVETGGHDGPVRLDDPDTHVLGRVVGEFTDYD